MGMLPQSVLDVLSGKARYAAIHSDGFALAREMGDGDVDLVIGDPAHDEMTHKGARTEKGGNKSPIDFDVCPPPEQFVPDLLRVAKRWVILCCAAEMLGDYKRAANADKREGYVRGGVWPKSNPMPQKTGDRPAQWGEAIAIMHRKGKRRWNSHGKPANWPGPGCNDPTRKHPTKKPLWLMEALLRDFCSAGEVVFDPTMGEATTGEACLRLGLRFIGCEIDAEKHQWAVERLARAEASGVQLSLPVREKRAKQEVLFT